MRIALVSHSAEHVDRGGPTTRIAGLAAAFERLGHTVHKIHNLESHVASGGYDIIHVFNTWPLVSAIRQLELGRAIAKRVVFSPIALNLTNKPFAEQGAVNVLEQSTSAQQVVTGFEAIRQIISRDTSPNDTVPCLHEGSAGHFDGLRAATKLADRVITLSAHERSFLDAIGASTHNTSLVWNGARQFQSSKQAAQRFKNQFGLDQFVLTVGRIESRKNQAAVAIAANDLNLPFVCIGTAHQLDYLQQVRKWSSNNLVHIPHTNDTDLLAGAYAAASVFCLPSWSEGAPISALEAFHAGTPMILSELSGEQEYFDQHARYTHPCDIKALVSAISERLNVAEPRTYSAPNSTLAERTTILSHAKQTLNVYREALLSNAEQAPEQGLSVKRSNHEASVPMLAAMPLQLTRERVAVEVWLTRQNRKYSIANLIGLVRNMPMRDVGYALYKRYRFRIRELITSLAGSPDRRTWAERVAPVSGRPGWQKTSHSKPGLVVQIYDRPSQEVDR
jgi:glycosyltransferase involved in cell wall biosynthesis